MKYSVLTFVLLVKFQPQVLAQGVISMFSKAEELFQKKRYKEASAAFAEIFKKYPEHEPSILLYGKTAFKLSQWKDAQYLFAKTDLTSLDVQSSYQYGYSHFKLKKWPEALKAFLKVPEKHALGDLAAYYGGFAAMRLKRFATAERLFDRAMVLPEDLSKKRDVYLKHLEDMRLMYQRDKLKLEKQREQMRIKRKRQQELAKEKEKQRQKELEETRKRRLHKKRLEQLEKESLYRGDTVLAQNAELKTYTKRQFSSNHGYVTKRSSRTLSHFQFQSGFEKQFLEGKTQKSFGLQASLKVEHEKRNGREQRVIVFEDEESRERVISEDLESYDIIDSVSGSRSAGIEDQEVQNGRVSARPWVEFGLGGSHWLALGGQISFKYPEFERGKRSGNRGGFLNFYTKADDLKISLLYEYSDLLDSETEPTATTGLGNLAVSGLVNDFSWKSSLTHKDFRYYLRGVEGPNSATSLSVEGQFSFPLGLNVGVFGAMELVSDYFVYRLEGFDSVSADGELLTGRVFARMQPLSWLVLELSQTYQQRTWKNYSSEASQDLWEEEIANYIEEFVWSVALYQEF